jgi:glutathione synthase/RimK-type ligase-like ATP-grasp enzyme
MSAVTRRDLEADMAAVETRLVDQPDSTDLRSERARLLFELGRVDEAKAQFLAILRHDGRHFSTLNNFGVLLHRTGATEAANRAYRAAIALEPANSIGHTNFADLLVQSGDLQTARTHYEQALRNDPQFRSAHRGLAVVFAALGDAERARHHQARQYAGQPLESFPYLGKSAPIPILVLMSAGIGNLPWLELIDNRVFAITTLATEFFDPSQPPPPHRLILNAIGDADGCSAALRAATTLLAQMTAPVINSPCAVLASGRVANAERFRQLPGVVSPRTVAVAHSLLTGSEGAAELFQRGLSFPLLLRSAGFHMGQHFVRVDAPDGLAAAAAALPGDELLAIQYLDARGTDGKTRKYRVMLIDGQLYPLHLAISDNWKVHYFSAEMSQNPQHQAEEADFLNDMPGVLGEKQLRALRQIARALGLDYAGIDFGLGRDGEILPFEANATMLIQPPGPEPEWDYRRAAIARALAAARKMVCDRALCSTETHGSTKARCSSDARRVA